MKKKVLGLFVAVAMLAPALPQVAHAGPADPLPTDKGFKYDDTDAFTKHESQGRKAARQYMGRDDDESDPYTNQNTDSFFLPRNIGLTDPSKLDDTNDGAKNNKYGGPSYNCNDEKCENEQGDVNGEQVNDDAQKYQFMKATNINKGHVNIYGSMTGFGEYMNSNTQINQKFDSVGSVAALANITLVMTEPGVAGGLHNAWMQTYADLNNKYLQDLHLMKQFELNPGVGVPAFEAWAACISKQLRGLKSSEGTKRGNDLDKPDVGSKGKSWLEAQAICNLDRSAGGTKTLNPNKQRFDKPVEGESKGVTTAEGTGFRFDHHWDWDGNELQKGMVDKINSDGRRPYAVKLSDLIFPQEYKTEATDAPELKKAFRDLIGDVTFQFQEKNDDAKNEKEIREGTRVMIYNTVKPRKTQEVWFRERFDQVYGILSGKILKMYCEDFRGKLCKNECENSNYILANTKTWTKYMDDLSVPNYALKTGVIRSMMEIYELYWRHRAPAGGELSCAGFQPDGAYSLERLRDGNGLGSPGNHFSTDATSPYADQLTRYMVGYADAITTMQLYNVYMAAEDLTNNMPDMAMDGQMRKAAMHLIKTAAGTDNPRGVYDQTMSRLKDELIPTYYTIMGQLGGWQVGASFTGTGQSAPIIAGNGPQ